MDDDTRKIRSDEQLLACAAEAAMRGAKAAREKQLSGLKPRRKSDDADDVVTQGDEAAQRVIIAALPKERFSGDVGEIIGVLAEEAGAEPITPDARWRWVIDPIDGTLPYSRSQHYWCVSIALQ